MEKSQRGIEIGFELFLLIIIQQNTNLNYFCKMYRESTKRNTDISNLNQIQKKSNIFLTIFSLFSARVEACGPLSGGHDGLLNPVGKFHVLTGCLPAANQRTVL